MIIHVKLQRKKSSFSHFPIFFAVLVEEFHAKTWPIKTIDLSLSKAFDLDMKIQVFLLALSAQGVR